MENKEESDNPDSVKKNNPVANENTLDQSTSATTPDSDRKAPKDHYHLVYIIFTLLGVGTLIPWNFFITATDYFIFQLNDSSPDSTTLMDNFSNSMTVSAMIPYAFFNVVNLFLTTFFKPTTRFHFGNALVFVCFVVTLVLVQAPTTSKSFFALTLLTVAVINSGSAVLQGAILGILSFLPPVHIGGFLEGQAIAGVISAIANLVVIAAASNKLSSATAYFAIALAFIAMGTSLFLLLPRNPHFSYYVTKNSSLEQKKHLMKDAGGESDAQQEVPIKERISLSIAISSMKQPGVYGFMAFFSLYVTLALFPSLFLKMKLTSEEPWKIKYYIPIFVFLLFNICDYASRKLAGLIQWPRQEQKQLMFILCLSRLILVFFMMFGNQHGKKFFPVWFSSDAFIPIFVILVGLSNGYFLTLAFMYAPSTATPGKEELVGVAMGLYIALGLALGVATSFPLKLLL